MEDIKEFSTENLCTLKDHTEFIYVQGATLCKKCSFEEIVGKGFVLTCDQMNLSQDIDYCIWNWLKNDDPKYNHEKIFEFFKNGFTKFVFKKYFEERLDNDDYCQYCGDKFYHKRCSCSCSY